MIYEGWTNYPTRAVNRWLSNEESLYRECVRATRGYCRTAEDKREAIGDLAEWIKRFTASLLPDVEGFAGDLLSYAVGEVN